MSESETNKAIVTIDPFSLVYSMTRKGKKSEEIEEAFILGGYGTREEVKVMLKAAKEGLKQGQRDKAKRQIRNGFLFLVGGFFFSMFLPILFYGAILYGGGSMIWGTLKLMKSLA